MNFVQLVESLRIECGVSGSPIVSVQNLSGELARLKMWIGDAWDELQTGRPDWKWLFSEFSFSTIASTQRYTATDAGVPNLDIWKQDSFWMYNESFGLSDQMPLAEMRWDHFREMYIRGVQYPLRPMCYSVNPDKSIWLGPLPDAAYTISGECWNNPVSLAADADAPLMPARFHKAVVYKAMAKYAGYEGASEVMERALTEGGPLYTKLEIDQLPPITIAGGFNGL